MKAHLGRPQIVIRLNFGQLLLGLILFASIKTYAVACTFTPSVVCQDPAHCTTDEISTGISLCAYMQFNFGDPSQDMHQVASAAASSFGVSYLSSSQFQEVAIRSVMGSIENNNLTFKQTQRLNMDVSPLAEAGKFIAENAMNPEAILQATANLNGENRRLFLLFSVIDIGYAYKDPQVAREMSQLALRSLKPSDLHRFLMAHADHWPEDLVVEGTARTHLRNGPSQGGVDENKCSLADYQKNLSSLMMNYDGQSMLSGGYLDSMGCSVTLLIRPAAKDRYDIEISATAGSAHGYLSLAKIEHKNLLATLRAFDFIF